MAECGCGCLPEAVVLLKPEVWCQEHGWQKPVRKATMRETVNMVLGLPLDFKPVDYDQPPF